MKIALIKETKTPIDNRVALSPRQVAELNKRFPQQEIVVQASDIRAATHNDPYYDYNPMNGQNEPAFSSLDNISVMSVDTCPNALAMDTSAYFGEMLTKHVFEPLLKEEHSDVIDRSMILKDGVLTPRFDYLTDFAKG